MNLNSMVVCINKYMYNVLARGVWPPSFLYSWKCTWKYHHITKTVAHFGYRDNAFVLLNAIKKWEIAGFFYLASNHPNEAVFSDTNVHIGTKFEQVGILDFETFVKPT